MTAVRLKPTLLAALLASSLFQSAWAVEPFVLKDIRVEGLQRADAGTVFASLPFRVGDTYTDDKGSAGLRALFATGLFADVKVTLRPVAENPGQVMIVLGVVEQSRSDRFAVGDIVTTAAGGWADTRIHGTTRRQVAAMFEEERPHLQALPASLFPAYQEARRTVHLDGFVEVAKSYYEAPVEWIGRKVWVQWDGRRVILLNDKQECLAAHARLEPGQFTRTRDGLGNVLRKIWHDQKLLAGRMQHPAADMVAAMLLHEPGQTHLLACHPRLSERIRRVCGTVLPPLPARLLREPVSEPRRPRATTPPEGALAAAAHIERALGGWQPAPCCQARARWLQRLGLTAKRCS